MTNELTYFTCVGYYYDIEAPSTSGTTNAAQFLGITGGFITFTPRVPTGTPILVSDLDLGSGNTGSAAIELAQITARVTGSIVGTEGGYVWQLSTINVSDTPGIQLLANSSVISSYLTAQDIEGGQLIYDVSFDQVTFAGANQTIQNFGFVAPTTSTTVCITDPSLETLPYQSP